MSLTYVEWFFDLLPTGFFLLLRFFSLIIAFHLGASEHLNFIQLSFFSDYWGDCWRDAWRLWVIRTFSRSLFRDYSLDLGERWLSSYD